MRTLTNFCLFLLIGLVTPFNTLAADLESAILETSAGQIEISVEIADEHKEIMTGLMYRDHLDELSGMLFDFGGTAERGMWMKNVKIPLDMLFLDAQGNILAIAHNAVPGSTRSINPGVPAAGVLEILGGQAEKLGIVPGDRVLHPRFGVES